MPDRPPVVMLAFANDHVEGGRYLRNLAVEQREIRKTLESLVDLRKAQLHVLTNATVTDIVDAFATRELVERVVIFHYGGHADDSTLVLEDEEGGRAPVHAERLAEYLARQKQLVLVFLNGCATKAQVARLRQLGVKAVVATSRAIKDDVASELARLFYQHLRVYPLREAFELAVAAAKLRGVQGSHRPRDAYRDDYRDLVPEARNEDELEWPWVLDCDEEFEGWRLVPEARSDDASREEAPATAPSPSPPPSVESSARRLGTGLLSALGGTVLILVAVAIWSTVHCLPGSADAALKVLVALGAGLLGGAVVGVIRVARRGTGGIVPSFLAGWNIEANSGAAFSVLTGLALFFLVPRGSEPQCEAKPEPEPKPDGLVVAGSSGLAKPDDGAGEVEPPLQLTPPPGMLYVRPGSFYRGSANSTEHYEDCRNAYGNECGKQTFERERQHAGPVEVPGFFLDEHEVTNAELAVFMKRLHASGEAEIVQDRGLVTVGGERPRVLVLFEFSNDERLEGHPYRAFVGDADDLAPDDGMAARPAVLVTWELASRYCRAQGKRLPTETEWEYAARGAESRDYVWGDKAIRCRDAAYGRLTLMQQNTYIECGNEEKRPNPVGASELDRSWCGVADMGVNVSEWVADVFVDPANGCPPAAASDGSAERELCHVYKGGNWVEPWRFSRLAYRPVAQPDFLGLAIGFRCAVSPKEVR